MLRSIDFMKYAIAFHFIIGVLMLSNNDILPGKIWNSNLSTFGKRIFGTRHMIVYIVSIVLIILSYFTLLLCEQIYFYYN